MHEIVSGAEADRLLSQMKPMKIVKSNKVKCQLCSWVDDRHDMRYKLMCCKSSACQEVSATGECEW